MRTIIQKGKIVVPGGVIEGSIIVMDNRISHIIKDSEPIPLQTDGHDCEIINAEGCYVMPGLVDFHCDMLEHAIQPRRKVFFPIKLALHSVEAPFLAAGITTIFHPVSFAGEPGLRSNELGNEIVRAIAELRMNKNSAMRHFTHVRWELNNRAGFEDIRHIIDEGLMDLFSVMDHSPRYTRFKTYFEYKNYVEKNSSLSDEELEKYTHAQWQMSEAIDSEETEKLIEFVAKHNIPFASHDDDSPQRLETYHLKGTTISEFPLNKDTAKFAIDNHMYSVVGAPNLLRNQSHAGNLSARWAVTNGLANIICSDYYCFSLLSSIFTLVEEGMSLHKATSYVSLYPALAVGLAEKIGSLEEGKEADLILVRHNPGGYPAVEKTMVAGRWTFSR